MQALHVLIDSEAALSTAHHPQTDGQTERVNQDLEQYFRMFVNQRQDDWVDWLACAEFAYNNRVHSATGQTPFFLNFGRHPRSPVTVDRATSVEAANTFAERMKESSEAAQDSLRDAAEDMKKYADEHRAEQPAYQVGDSVYLDGSHIATTRPSKKLEDRRYGPYKIAKVISPTAMRLSLPSRMHIHPVFHVSKLRPAVINRDLHPDAATRPGPVLVEGEEQYQVERILDSRYRAGHLEYLIKWDGYPREESTWEREEDSDISRSFVTAFYKAHPNAPKRISSSAFHQINFQTLPRNLTEVDIAHADGLYFDNVPFAARAPRLPRPGRCP
jgi:hypothetical protein